jgi:hypothetical protein
MSPKTLQTEWKEKLIKSKSFWKKAKNKLYFLLLYLYNSVVRFIEQRESLVNPGSQWVFSEENAILKPSDFVEARGNHPECLNDLLGTTERLTQPDWKFESALFGERRRNIVFVFSHPKYGMSSSAPEHDDLVIPAVLERRSPSNVFIPGTLKKWPFDNVLKGTNFAVSTVSANFNKIWTTQRAGFLRRAYRTLMYQGGIGYIDIAVHELEFEIAILRQKIKTLDSDKKIFTKELREASEMRLEQLTKSRTSNPIPLLSPFQN